MEDTKQDMATYKFNDIIVRQNKKSLTLCDFFEITNFNPSQFFDSSFWCALNSLDDDEWFEVTDDVIEKIGFKGESKKCNFRTNLFKCIKKHFVENIDYMFTLHNVKVTNGSGNHNKNTLKMKRDSFKMLLMKVNTQHSDQIYKYLIAFENNVKQYAIYQHECQLYQQQIQLTNTHEENVRLKALTDAPTLDSFRKNALTINKQKRAVYVFTSKRYASLDLYKIGISFSPKKRKMNINTTHVLKDDEFYQVHSVECYDADVVEKYIHDTLDQYRYRKEREFFLLPLPLIKTVIDSVASLFNDCYDRINDAIETWNKPSYIAETKPQLLLAPPSLQQQTAPTPANTESDVPRVQQTTIPMEIVYDSMNMNSLDKLCTICDEHSLNIEVLHFLSIYPEKSMLQDVYLRENNINIYDIKKLASDLKITKAATVNTKELLLEKIAVFYNCL